MACRGASKLTPLTTFVVSADAAAGSFELEPVARHRRRTASMPGFEFKPFALIGGTVFVGFRRFERPIRGCADYSGAGGRRRGELPHRDATRFDISVAAGRRLLVRDARSRTTLLTDVGVNVTQRVTRRGTSSGAAPAGARLSRIESLVRPRSAGAPTTATGYGGGVGLSLGDSVRARARCRPTTGGAPTLQVAANTTGSASADRSDTDCNAMNTTRLPFSLPALVSGASAARPDRLRGRRAGRADDHRVRPGGHVGQVHGRDGRHVHVPARSAASRPAGRRCGRSKRT